MKRLGVFVAITVLAVSLFGGFSSPKQAVAAFETAQQEALNTFQKATFIDKYTPQQRGDYLKYLDAFKDILAKRGATMSSAHDDSSFQQNALNDFENYIKKTADDPANASPEKMKVLNDTASLITAYSMSIASGQFDDGFYAAMGGGAGPIQSQSQAQATANAQLATTLEKGSQKTSECSLGFVGKMNLGACISEGVAWLIRHTLLEIAGFLLWLTANMFNYSVQIGILDFAKWAPDALYPVWMIVRQIVSLVVVFVGLYLGFMYILGREETFAKYIPWVVMFALFVNFSYPLTRTAIDISNIVSLKIYASAVGNNALTGAATEEDTAGALIMQSLGLQGLVMSASKADGSTTMLGDLNSISGALIAVAFVLYAAYIFFMVTALMVIRTASLVFLTIASPLLLVDSVIPVLGDKAKDVRKIFFEQLAVGPVFMIMLALTIKFLEVFSSGPFKSASAGDKSITMVFNILLMLIMLHIMFKVTKSVSGTMGQAATNFMGSVGGFGLGVATGGAGLLARKGIGGLAAKARDSGWVQKNQDSFIGRRAYDLTNSVANSTFDLRNSKIVAGRMNKLGMGMGMGAKLGYDEERKARLEAVKKDVLDRGNRIKTKYERDVIKDGKIIHRKGDVNEEGTKAKDEYFAKNGGALFLTKDQKESLSGDYVDTTGGEMLTNYKKESKTGKRMFSEQVNKELEELKKTDPELKSNRGQTLARIAHDIGKEEKDYKENLNKEVEKAVREINALSEDKKAAYHARLSDDVREMITATKTPTLAGPDGVNVKGGTVYSAKGETETAKPNFSQGGYAGGVNTGTVIPAIPTNPLQATSTQTQQVAASAAKPQQTNALPTTSGATPEGRPVAMPGESASAFAARAAKYRKEQQTKATQTPAPATPTPSVSPAPVAGTPVPPTSAPTAPAANAAPVAEAA